MSTLPRDESFFVRDCQCVSTPVHYTPYTFLPRRVDYRQIIHATCVFIVTLSSVETRFSLLEKIVSFYCWIRTGDLRPYLTFGVAVRPTIAERGGLKNREIVVN